MEITKAENPPPLFFSYGSYHAVTSGDHDHHQQQRLRQLKSSAQARLPALLSIKIISAPLLLICFVLAVLIAASLYHNSKPNGLKLRLIPPFPASSSISAKSTSLSPPSHDPASQTSQLPPWLEENSESGALPDSTAAPVAPEPAAASSTSCQSFRSQEQLHMESKTIMHNMTDEELFQLARSTLKNWKNPTGVLKVAFLFLLRWDLPMAPLWENFFEGYQDRYSIYVHTNPYYNGLEPAKDSVFHGRAIPSKVVKWGEISMVEAERRLLANALLDHSNQRFILLSESHVPLFNFPTVHTYLINSTKFYLESYDLPDRTSRGRYTHRMLPVVSIEQWRKGSQWFEIDRAFAADVINDDTVFPVFKRHCRRGCYADEHYLPTLLNIKRPSMGANRSLTWVDWSQGGPHPKRFIRSDVTVEFLEWLRSGNVCDYNGRSTTTCFLFARKFLPNSLVRFMRFAPQVMGFG